MASYQYSRAQLLSDINVGIFGKIGMLPNTEDFANSLVREVHNELSIRSTRKRAALSPDLNPEVIEYTCPTDLRDNKIVDINPDDGEDRVFGEINLIPMEQFMRRSKFGDIAIDERSGTRILFIQTRYSNGINSSSPIITADTFITYYSKFPWLASDQTTYKLISTDDSDLLVADESEYDLFVKKGIVKASRFTNMDSNLRAEAKQDYKDAVTAYTGTNLDESKVFTSTYHFQ